MKTTHRVWLTSEHDQLVALRNEGISLGEISRRLGRSMSSISIRLRRTDENGKYLSRAVQNPLADMRVDDLLLELHRAGCGNEQIGEIIGFKPASIRSRIQKLLSAESAPVNPDRKERPCISCRKPMISDSWRHRRCALCIQNLRRSDVFHEEWSIYV